MGFWVLPGSATSLLHCPPLVFNHQFPCCLKKQERNWLGHTGLYLFLNFCKISSLSFSFFQLQDLQVSFCFWMRQCLVWSLHREYPPPGLYWDPSACSFERKGVSCHGESGFLALSGWRQGSRTPLWPSEVTTSCCWIQYLASPQELNFHLSQSKNLMVLWLPGDQGLLSCSPSMFLKLVSLWGGVGPLFQTIQVLTLPKLHCPGKREPTLTLDRCCSALQGRSVFLLLPLCSLTLYVLLSAALQQIPGESQ